MEREIKFDAAWDKRSADPSKDYGVHGAEMAWYLKGKHGVIQFKTMLGWDLPHIRGDRYDKIRPPSAYDVGYHSYKPMYDGQQQIMENCPLLGGPCYYDGSSLAADRMFDLLVEKGSDAVWAEMEDVYRNRFGELE